ncbi:MAG: dihydropteroate synthase [Cyclobacteriaceae bacterium]
MGILNTTPDSFYQESRLTSVEDTLIKADQMINEGATFLDVGGYSSRPDAEDISINEELRRTIPYIEALHRVFPGVPISIDTFRREVAEQAVKAGATMVNDISGGSLDKTMLDFIAESKTPYIAMHMKGTPQTMQHKANYDDINLAVISYFSKLIDKCSKLGIHDLVIDPGFGFAKTLDQCYKLLSKMELLTALNKPILIGLSRKSMIYKFLEITPQNALNGTTTLNTVALLKGANILRVHDVKPAMESIALIEKLTNC